MTKNGVTKYQIEDLTEDVNHLKDDVKRVLENHLPHLHEEIQSLKVSVRLGIAINVLLVISSVVGVVLLLK